MIQPLGVRGPTAHRNGEDCPTATSPEEELDPDGGGAPTDQYG
ncbi:hypothetical protein SynWH8103_01268 [Synechococcus sp. WH 8103]|nr:hypothetical protein SynWH8103_01268 [Synechococcus sp. WH 8103]